MSDMIVNGFQWAAGRALFGLAVVLGLGIVGALLVAAAHVADYIENRRRKRQK